MERRKSVGVGSTLAKLGVAALLAAAAFDGSRAAAQDSADTAPAPAPDSTDQVIREEHVPFTPWPEQPGAIAFDALPQAEQDAIMRQSEWAETRAYEVTQAWSAYAHQAAANAAVQRAAHLSGLNGTEDIGVSP